MKIPYLIIMAMLVAGSTVADYRMDTKTTHSDGTWLTTYTGYDQDTVCITGTVILSNGVHVSTLFEIHYMDEVAVRTVRKAGDEKAAIELVNNALRYETEYEGRPMQYVMVHDKALRRSPLPGFGSYVIDPDGHIRFPKPEEYVAIWSNRKTLYR